MKSMIGNIKFGVKASRKDQTIEMLTVNEGINEKVIRQIVNLKEDAIRAALIDLGWTPPKK